MDLLKKMMAKFKNVPKDIVKEGSPFNSLLDPAGLRIDTLHKKQVPKDIMKEGIPFKMKGFPQHIGISPLKQDIEYPNMLSDIEVRSSESSDDPKIDKKLKRKTKRKAKWKAFKKDVTDFTQNPIGETITKIVVGKALETKPKKKPTRIISEDWKIQKNV